MALHDRDSPSPSGTGVPSTSLNSLLESFIQQAQELLNSDASPSADLAYRSLPAPLVQATQESLARQIDHTLLKPEATPQDVQKVCEEALTYGFATVCLNTSYISQAAKLLHGSSVKPIAVIGFPLGVCTTETKVFETQEAIRLGAQEIDMVIHVGALKSAHYEYVLRDIRQVVQAAGSIPVKVILETSSLNQEQKIAACALSKAAGAAFVKTSTGFGTGGATIEDVTLMRKVVGPEMGVKASGGIRTYDDMMKMLQAGATRIGASASVQIVTAKKSGPNTDASPAAKGPKGY